MRFFEANITSNVLSHNARYHPFGSYLAGSDRKTTETTYGYSLNGQRKVDEMNNVSGSHTSALFREYNTRLGRRWNLDPVYKTHQSNYVCFSDNPLIMTDPLGNDDYFSTAGKFLGSDKSGGEHAIIRVVDARNISLIKRRSDGTIMRGSIVKKSQNLSAFLTDKNHKQLLRVAMHVFVFDHYAKEVGATGEVEMGYEDNENVPAYELDGTLFANINYRRSGDMDLDDIDDVKNILFHEKTHQEGKYGRSDSQRPGFDGYDHAKVVLTSIMDNTWINTTSNHKYSQVAYAAKLILPELRADYSNTGLYTDAQAAIDQFNLISDRTRYKMTIIDTDPRTTGAADLQIMITDKDGGKTYIKDGVK